jgi:uroporphyrin-III C-methyltransferase
MLFGRAHEEIEYLRARGIRTEVVPGITAARGARAELEVTQTQPGVARREVLATTRAAEGAQPSSWVQAVAAADTAVLYMASAEAAQVRDALLDAGMRADLPVAVAENVSLDATTRAGVLHELPRLSAGCSGPALLLIGQVFARISTKSVDMSVESRRYTAS